MYDKECRIDYMAASNHVENMTTGNDVPAIAICFKHKISVFILKSTPHGSLDNFHLYSAR